MTIATAGVRPSEGIVDASVAEQAPIVCPACGGNNPHDGVFCANPACCKALGEFKYVLEEMRAHTRWHESLAQRATAFIAKPQFLALHAAWFFTWVAVNSAMVALAFHFDAYPFPLLGIVLAIEAIFMSCFILITQNRQNAYADKRAELDYEVSVRSFREIRQALDLMRVNLEELRGIQAGTRPEAAAERSD
ncbi:MAG: DUF1003 domain-containing protein [Candidatus Binatales bacterium]